MKAAAIGVLSGLLAVALVSTGILELHLPDALRLDRLARSLVHSDQEVAQKGDATMVRIEPVSLDCRARIQATVPVTGTREHTVAGFVVRTDTVTIDARGDVDTCVDAGSVTVVQGDDGSFAVDVPGEAISFVRPRVDLVSSAQHVEYDQGLLGELTDLLPGVDDTETLTLSAFAFAQQVIGGQACMQEAFAVTSQVLQQAYVDQLAAQGVAASMVTVTVGQPDFGQHPVAAPQDDTTFAVRGGIRCQLAADAHQGASPGWASLLDQT